MVRPLLVLAKLEKALFQKEKYWDTLGQNIVTSTHQNLTFTIGVASSLFLNVMQSYVNQLPSTA